MPLLAIVNCHAAQSQTRQGVRAGKCVYFMRMFGFQDPHCNSNVSKYEIFICGNIGNANMMPELVLSGIDPEKGMRSACPLLNVLRLSFLFRALI
jgi:hypothetical protein